MSKRLRYRGFRGRELICFFCLKPVKPSEAKVVVINDEYIGMDFRVIACSDCAERYGSVIKLKAPSQDSTQK
ncbi:MAG: hypothetical protein AT712_05875 [Caldivirga sp. CIS_19]|jgi:hypothetical protein|nr:MAG: hypothetical protein AT712_05875 [Caldivirga sp. CIS_19]